MTELEEAVARVLEPQAWAALGLRDTLAYKNRRTSSMRKARAAIAAVREAMAEPSNEMIVAAHEHHEGEFYLPVSLYRAMLAASPLAKEERP